MTECYRQGLVDRCLKRHDFRNVKPLLHLLRIEVLKAADAILQPRDTAASLFDGEDVTEASFFWRRI